MARAGPVMAPQAGHGYKCSLFAPERGGGGQGRRRSEGAGLCLTPGSLRHKGYRHRRANRVELERRGVEHSVGVVKC